MKIVVDEMPKSPSECLFSNRKKYMELFSLKGERYVLHMHYCKVDDEMCELEKNSDCGCCSKLVDQKEKLLRE